ncbi:low molecular weight protein arginine phosphatase [Tuberibacillus sp. Marseille-P3662]|uniref:low molecular weight protein arginine phosphatase n=1 Tax=Tuberibacillus sp. Marseille-P3662 TaxID=1965358 RepID=UPI0015940973|nr:low molecular weight protein arginine phosphatase [Tuberibacillus sp. Marseille-P3662]
MNVLFVCTGNTCRSPMAEQLLRQKGPGHIQVQSAGIYAMKGQSAHPNAVNALADRGVACEHSSRPLDRDLTDWADYILTMTEGHKMQVLQTFPTAQNKVFTLKEFVNAETASAGNWEDLQKAIAEYETKRAEWLHVCQNPDLSADERQKKEQQMHEDLQVNLDDIHTLENAQPSLDISDPFGASEDVYSKVCSEIEALIDQLSSKLR